MTRSSTQRPNISSTTLAERRRGWMRRAALAAGVVLVGGLACGEDATGPAPPPPPPPPPPPVATTVAVSPGTARLSSVGETAQLSAEVRDQNGRAMPGATVTWTSSDPSVVTVDASGLVTAAGDGTAMVTAASGSASGSATVTVEQSAERVAVTPDTAALVVGDTVRLSAAAFDALGNEVAGASFTWSSGDTLVAEVDESGLVRGLGPGRATVTASSGTASGTALVSVDQSVERVSVTPDSASLLVGDTARLSAAGLDALGNEVAGASFTWSSADTLVATIDSGGLATGIATGTAEITATSSGVEGRARLVVTVAAPTTVAVTPDSVNLMALGDTVRLSAEVLDQVGRPMPGRAVEWSSGDPAVASVDSTGLVRAEGSGATTVTASSGSASGSASVSVMQSASSVTVTPAEASIGPGDTLRLAAQALDANGHVVAGAEFSWSSSDESVATVDGSGLVRGVAEGTATITAAAEELDATSEITVANPDRAVLVALYKATHGPNWVNSENWVTDAPLGEWYGVSTDGSGRVASLNLSGTYDPADNTALRHGLLGTIPPELGSLANLRELNLSRNELTGSIPPELGTLTNLNSLLLDDNGLSGPIPSELGNIISLKSLGLASNRLSGQLPAELGNLVNLVSLRLSANDLSGPIPFELGNLHQLRSLWLHYNRLTGPFPKSLLDVPISHLGWNCGAHGLCVPGTSEFVEWIAGIVPHDGPFCNAGDQSTLSNLFELTGGEGWAQTDGWLGGPALEEWHGVQTDSLGRVTVLHLSDNGLSGGLPAVVGNLTHLTELHIDGNTLDGPLPLSLTQLELAEFHYDGTTLCAPTDDGFRAWLGGIESHSGTGADCPPLTDRDILTILYEATGGADWKQNGNWLSDDPLDKWYGVEINHQGRVVGLNLMNNALVGVIPPELGDLTNLESLLLGGSRLSGPIPPELGKLSHLQVLDVRTVLSAGLTGPIPPELGRLANLRSLLLSRNRLSGPIPPQLGNLVKLHWLDVGSNELTGPIPPALGNLSGLFDLDIGSNHLTGPIPPELGSLDYLVVLDVASNDLSGAIPSELGGLAGLEVLELASNPALAGAVPASLRELRLKSFHAGGTDLCVPKEPEFEVWLETVSAHWIAWCGDIPMVYLTQAVQSHAHPVPLVAGDDALLRVFVTTTQDSTAAMPPVRARFYLDGAEQHPVNIAATSTPIPNKVEEGDLGKSANARIPGRTVRPGLEMVVEIDPDGTLNTGLGLPRRIPKKGRMRVDVLDVPVLNLTLIPFLLSGRPDSAALRTASGMAADPAGHDGLRETRDLLPVGQIEVTSHDPVISTSFGTGDVIRQVAAIRALEGGKGHYMGLASGSPTPVPGAFVGGWVSVSDLRPDVIAHELGHNMSLRHAPCGAPVGLDPHFPDADGSIGAWGYDLETGRLVEPGSPDLMSYCSLPWISAYHFVKALRYRRLDENVSTAIATPVTRSLLVWGGVDADGEAFLNPAFVVDAPVALPDSAGAYSVTGRDAGGGELFSLSFAMPVLADAEGASSFVFAVPAEAAWEGRLASVTLSGPDGEVVLDGETNRPMAILRDPASGQVRGFFSELSQDVGTAAAAAAAIDAEPGLRVLFSRGIPDAAAWRR